MLAEKQNFLNAKYQALTQNGTIAPLKDKSLVMTSISIRLQAVFLMFFSSLLLATPCFSQKWRWAIQAGGAGADTGTSVVTDSEGNTFVSGSFTGSAQFGSFTLTSRGGSDVYIGKLDSNQQWLWVQQLGSVGSEGYSRIFQSSSGILVVRANADSGAFVGNNPIIDGPGRSNGYDLSNCIIRLDPQTGAYQWAARCVDTLVGSDIAFGLSGQIYVAGSFRSDSLRLGNIKLANSGGVGDAYVASISSTGTWEWVLGSSGVSSETASGLAVDNNGNILVCGDMGLSLDSTYFGSHAVASNGSSYGGGFIARITNQQWTWAIPVWGQGVSYTQEIIIDEIGNIYVICDAEGSAAYIGSDVVQSPSFTPAFKAFVAKLSPLGQLKWGTSIGNDRNATLSYAALDNKNGSIFITGYTDADSLWFGDTLLYQTNTNHGFTAAIDSAGHWLWAMPRTGALAYGSDHSLTFAGTFSDSLAFDQLLLTNATPTTTNAYFAQLALPPFVLRFSPATGPAGTVVTLSGSGFAGTTAVFFGTIPATFTVLPNGQIQVTVPAGIGTQGVSIRVVNANGTGQSVGLFGRGTVGIAPEQPNNPSFTLFPNPTSGLTQLIAQAPLAASGVEVLNPLGQVVRWLPGGKTSLTLDLSNLPAGIYTIRAGAVAKRIVLK
jgi:hypothetical protein